MSKAQKGNLMTPTNFDGVGWQMVNHWVLMIPEGK